MGNSSGSANQNGRFTASVVAFLALIAVGTVGYKVIEGPQWTWLDALYMTVITLGTIGYGEVHTLDTGGRIFTVCLILMGAGVMAYTVTTLAQFVVEGKLQELWGKKRMKDRIDALKDHYVVCGAGDTGLVVVGELTRRKIPFVVVESNPKVAESLIEGDVLVVEGDATVDEVLRHAGLERAGGLVTTLPHDADNVFVALTAREMKANIFVVSTANKNESVTKLKRAGVSYVVSPNQIAGARMASVIMRPSVVDFLDATMAGENQALQMEELRIGGGSFLANKALKDADLRRRSGAIIVSVKRGTSTVINPEPTYVFETGDILIVLGTRDQITKMGDIALGA